MQKTKPQKSILIIEKNLASSNIIAKYLSTDFFVVETEPTEIQEKLDVFVPDAIIISIVVLSKISNNTLKKIIENKEIALVLLREEKTMENKEQSLLVREIIKRADMIMKQPLLLEQINSKLHVLLYSKKKGREMKSSKISSIDLSKKTVSDLFDDLFSFVLLFHESFPVYSSGGFIITGDKKITMPEGTDSEQLISAFMSAIQTFIASTFGQKVSEISMGTHHFFISTTNSLSLVVLINKIMLSDMELELFKKQLFPVLENILLLIKPIIPKGIQLLSSNIVRKCEIIIMDELLSFTHTVFGT